MLSGRRILLGITGSIAAYKITLLVRSLQKQGAEVKVILTPSAKDFVTPLTLSTLSKNPVYSTYFDDKTGEWNNHVALGLWADLFVIAPATANTISKMAHGQADNLLLATYLSARCPVWVAPAMDLDMWKHDSTQDNIELLANRGNHIVPPASGELASGLTGQGRMAEPELLEKLILDHFTVNGPLNGKKVLISAGPTVEPIDPVRYITNHSSGKMGYALAERARDLGAKVLVSGPVSLQPPKSVDVIKVETAEEMKTAVEYQFKDADITIMAAAVADYTPSDPQSSKIKKSNHEQTLTLKKTTDILKSLGEQKNGEQVLVGFALETDNEIAHAQQKLERKNLDFIVLNSLNNEGAGFSGDTNKVTIIDKNNNQVDFELKSKSEVARDIFNYIETSA